MRATTAALPTISSATARRSPTTATPPPTPSRPTGSTNTTPAPSPATLMSLGPQGRAPRSRSTPPTLESAVTANTSSRSTASLTPPLPFTPPWPSAMCFSMQERISMHKTVSGKRPPWWLPAEGVIKSSIDCLNAGQILRRRIKMVVIWLIGWHLTSECCGLKVNRRNGRRK